ncbi:hypothetical protein DFS34DRAFT_665665 [Phlyctochytrium arcticum]|nr:hypothetical protein DFS34DRAFT_665665 [Phlyctochytrium arcticum]
MTHYRAIFESELVKNSVADTLEEAILEWTVKGTFYRDNLCICTHKIKENCEVQSVINGKTLIIGNCCITRFFPEHEREKMCEDLRKRKAITKKCEICKKRHYKQYALNEELCDRCHLDVLKCVKCGDYFPCSDVKERTWKTMCLIHWAESKNAVLKRVPKKYDPKEARRKTRDCARDGCNARISKKKSDWITLCDKHYKYRF